MFDNFDDDTPDNPLPFDLFSNDFEDKPEPVKKVQKQLSKLESKTSISQSKLPNQKYASYKKENLKSLCIESTSKSLKANAYCVLNMTLDLVLEEISDICTDFESKAQEIVAKSKAICSKSEELEIAFKIKNLKKIINQKRKIMEEPKKVENLLDITKIEDFSILHSYEQKNEKIQEKEEKNISHNLTEKVELNKNKSEKISKYHKIEKSLKLQKNHTSEKVENIEKLNKIGNEKNIEIEKHIENFEIKRKKNESKKNNKNSTKNPKQIRIIEKQYDYDEVCKTEENEKIHNLTIETSQMGKNIFGNQDSTIENVPLTNRNQSKLDLNPSLKNFNFLDHISKKIFLDLLKWVNCSSSKNLDIYNHDWSTVEEIVRRKYFQDPLKKIIKAYGNSIITIYEKEPACNSEILFNYILEILKFYKGNLYDDRKSIKLAYLDFITKISKKNYPNETELLKIWGGILAYLISHKTIEIEEINYSYFENKEQAERFIKIASHSCSYDSSLFSHYMNSSFVKTHINLFKSELNN